MNHDQDIQIEICPKCNRAPVVVRRYSCDSFGERAGIRCWLICRSCENVGRVQKVESNTWSTFFGAFKHAAWNWNKMIEKQAESTWASLPQVAEAGTWASLPQVAEAGTWAPDPPQAGPTCPVCKGTGCPACDPETHLG